MCKKQDLYFNLEVHHKTSKTLVKNAFIDKSFSF